MRSKRGLCKITCGLTKPLKILASTPSEWGNHWRVLSRRKVLTELTFWKSTLSAKLRTDLRRGREQKLGDQWWERGDNSGERSWWPEPRWWQRWGRWLHAGRGLSVEPTRFAGTTANNPGLQRNSTGMRHIAGDFGEAASLRKWPWSRDLRSG